MVLVRGKWSAQNPKMNMYFATVGGSDRPIPRGGVYTGGSPCKVYAGRSSPSLGGGCGKLGEACNEVLVFTPEGTVARRDEDRVGELE